MASRRKGSFTERLRRLFRRNNSSRVRCKPAVEFQDIDEAPQSHMVEIQRQMALALSPQSVAGCQQEDPGCSSNVGRASLGGGFCTAGTSRSTREFQLYAHDPKKKGSKQTIAGLGCPALAAAAQSLESRWINSACVSPLEMFYHSYVAPYDNRISQKQQQRDLAEVQEEQDISTRRGILVSAKRASKDNTIGSIDSLDSSEGGLLSCTEDEDFVSAGYGGDDDDDDGGEDVRAVEARRFVAGAEKRLEVGGDRRGEKVDGTCTRLEVRDLRGQKVNSFGEKSGISVLEEQSRGEDPVTIQDEENLDAGPEQWALPVVLTESSSALGSPHAELRHGAMKPGCCGQMAASNAAICCSEDGRDADAGIVGPDMLDVRVISPVTARGVASTSTDVLTLSLSANDVSSADGTTTPRGEAGFTSDRVKVNAFIDSAKIKMKKSRDKVNVSGRYAQVVIMHGREHSHAHPSQSSTHTAKGFTHSESRAATATANPDCNKTDTETNLGGFLGQLPPHTAFNICGENVYINLGGKKTKIKACRKKNVAGSSQPGPSHTVTGVGARGKKGKRKKFKKKKKGKLGENEGRDEEAEGKGERAKGKGKGKGPLKVGARSSKTYTKVTYNPSQGSSVCEIKNSTHGGSQDICPNAEENSEVSSRQNEEDERSSYRELWADEAASLCGVYSSSSDLPHNAAIEKKGKEPRAMEICTKPSGGASPRPDKFGKSNCEFLDEGNDAGAREVLGGPDRQELERDLRAVREVCLDLDKLHDGGASVCLQGDEKSGQVPTELSKNEAASSQMIETADINPPTSYDTCVGPRSCEEKNTGITKETETYNNAENGANSSASCRGGVDKDAAVGTDINDNDAEDDVDEGNAGEALGIRENSRHSQRNDGHGSNSGSENTHSARPFNVDLQQQPPQRQRVEPALDAGNNNSDDSSQGFVMAGPVRRATGCGDTTDHGGRHEIGHSSQTSSTGLFQVSSLSGEEDSRNTPSLAATTSREQHDINGNVDAAATDDEREEMVMKMVDDAGFIDVFALKQTWRTENRDLKKLITRYRQRCKRTARLQQLIAQLRRETEEMKRMVDGVDRQTVALRDEATDVRTTLSAVCDVTGLVRDAEARSLEPACYRRYLNIRTTLDAVNLLTAIRSRIKALGELEVLVYRKQLMLHHVLPGATQDRVSAVPKRVPRPTQKGQKLKKNEKSTSQKDSIVIEVVSPSPESGAATPSWSEDVSNTDSPETTFGPLSISVDRATPPLYVLDTHDV